jgi:hypothetical protein
MIGSALRCLNAAHLLRLSGDLDCLLGPMSIGSCKESAK